MTTVTRRIVYPEGDTQEIAGQLRIDQIVDLNGNPLTLPLPTTRMIVYRVYRITQREVRGEIVIDHCLEQLGMEELCRLASDP
jgi:hypothetical protein